MTTIDCTSARGLLRQERVTPGEEALLGAHLSACDGCRQGADRLAPLSDSLVAAAASAGRYRRAARRAVAVALAASLFAVIGLALRPSRPPDRVYIIRGDSSGVVVTGPGISRRGETISPPRHSSSGDRT